MKFTNPKNNINLENFGKNKGLISNDNPIIEDENEDEDDKPESSKDELEDKEIYVNIKT